MSARKEKWDKPAYDLEEAKENCFNVSGTINYMDLGFKAKKPDWKKLEKLMKKVGKPAQYYMTMTGLVWTFEVHVGTTKMVINRFDVGKLRKVSEQRDFLRKLSDRTKVVTKDDLVKFDKENADPEDSKEAVSINEEIDKLRNAADSLRGTAQDQNYRKKTIDKALWSQKEFLAWCKKKGYLPFAEFIMEVDADRGWSSKVTNFLKLGRKTGLKDRTLADLLMARNSGDDPDWDQARKEVAGVLNRAILPKYNKEKMSELAKKIKEYEAKAKKLERQLKSLKAA